MSHLNVGQTVAPGAVGGAGGLAGVGVGEVVLEVAGGDPQQVHPARVVGLQPQCCSVVVDGSGHVTLQ